MTMDTRTRCARIDFLVDPKSINDLRMIGFHSEHTSSVGVPEELAELVETMDLPDIDESYSDSLQTPGQVGRQQQRLEIKASMECLESSIRGPQ
jgi:hypothetical protein